MLWHNKGTIYVNEDSTKRHYYIAGTKFHATLVYDTQYSYQDDFFYFDCEKFPSGPPLRRIYQGSNSYTFNPEIRDDVILKKALFMIGDYSSDWNSVTANGYGEHIYGEKATPIVNSDFASGFIKYTDSKDIVYSSGYIDGITEQYNINGVILHYKESTETTYTNEISSASNTVAIPANTLLANKNYDMYSDVTMDDGTVFTTEKNTATTIDSKPTVTIISPNNEVIYGSGTFEWNYSVETGMPQYAFDIQLSTDKSTWVDAISHEISSKTSKLIIVDSQYSYWRVRGYNQTDVPSEWSAAGYFVNNIKPHNPTITEIRNGGRPTISWASGEQVAYRLIIGSYDTGEVYTTDKSCFVNEYIQNGNYECKLAISNQYGLWSDWLTFYYSQNLVIPSPAATIEQADGYAEITITSEQFSKYYIIRNGTVIAKTTNRVYKDYFVNGKVQYIIRGVMADDTFADTAIDFEYACKVSCLISPSLDIFKANENLDSRPKVTYSITRSAVSNEYLGRTKPVHYENKLINRVWQVSCTQEINTGQLGSVLFYRNISGDSAWVVCNSASASENIYGNVYDLALEETDYTEEIEYDL